jgi:hypothetical protein
MESDPRVTAFSFRRQRLDGSAGGALEAVASVVGVYGANPSGPLSIRARAPGVSAADVLALDGDRAAVRMRAMRTSAFLVPRSTAPAVRAATAVPLVRFTWMLRAARVDPGSFAGVRAAVLAAAATPAAAPELRARAGLDGVEIGPLTSMLVLRGDLVSVGSGSVTSNASRYLSREAWLAGEPEAPEPDAAEARAWLAGAYLRAFGPARAADLAWWSGMNGRQAADAIAAHDTVDVGGGLVLLASDLAEFEAGRPLDGAATLLPKWDAWTMGYPLGGRERFLGLDVHDRVFDGDGNGLGIVLVAGRAAGAWTHRGAGRAMAVDLDLFEPPGARLRERLETSFADMAAFLGYRGVRVRDVPTVVPLRRRIRRPLA